MDAPSTTTNYWNPVVSEEARDALDKRLVSLSELCAFVSDQLADPTHGLTLHIHRLPVALFDEKGPFDSVLVREREGGTHYLVGTKRFGDFELTGFSVDIAAND